MTLSYAQFRKLAKNRSLVPFVEEVIVDLETPLSVYLKLPKSSGKFLLESVEGGARWGRYSLVGVDPFCLFRSYGSTVEILRGKNKKLLKNVADPLKELEALMGSFRAGELAGLGPFNGGALGYLAYDTVRHFEKLPNHSSKDLLFYDSYFMFPRLVLTFDNIRQATQVVYYAEVDGSEDLKKVYHRAVRQLRQYVKLVQGRGKASLPRTGPKMRVRQNLTQQQFEAAVQKAKNYIRAGDVIQTVLSLRFQTGGGHDPLSIYRALRRINPSPYMFIFEFGDHYLAASSPETMVRLDGRELSLRPIAGTRPRGKDEKDDLRLEEELLNDPKERAEHIMLVDLGRNDLGRVAQEGSVTVSDLMIVERYSHVMHIVSNVNARLAEGKTPYDVLRATFPAGTLSGAPKVRAMEIIEELEPTRRGPYGGCAGYISFSGHMDMAITIRACYGTKKYLAWQAGAGIVADSNPTREYQECLNKAKAVAEAIESVERE